MIFLPDILAPTATQPGVAGDPGIALTDACKETLRRLTGGSGDVIGERHVLQVSQVPSPLGPILIAGDDDAVYLVEFDDRRVLDKQFAALRKRMGAEFSPGRTRVICRMADELAAYFAGRLREFRTPVKSPGSRHQEQVWNALLRVPYGVTMTYGALAAQIGRPSAVRSVARAVGENRLAIVLPCHRILGANGLLTGYSGGLGRKQDLLNLEHAAPEK